MVLTAVDLGVAVLATVVLVKVDLATVGSVAAPVTLGVVALTTDTADVGGLIGAAAETTSGIAERSFDCVDIMMDDCNAGVSVYTFEGPGNSGAFPVTLFSLSFSAAFCTLLRTLVR